MPSVDNHRALKVFLCHAHSDKDAVKALYARLKREGVDVWLDKEKLLPGADWEYEIRKAVREADVVVVCLSKQFNQAGFRQKEVRIALDAAMEKPEGEIFIIPARLEECDTLESLSKWHWVDLFEDNGYEMLMRALRAQASKIDAILQIKKNYPLKFSYPRQDEETSTTADAKQENKRKVFLLNVGKISLNFLMKNIAPLLLALFAIVGSFYMLTIYIPKYMPNLFQTPTVDLMIIPQSTSTPTKDFAPTTTALPDEIMDDGIPMRLVPAGEFTMGSEYGDDDEKPVHQVYLDAFYMDKYEVTNALYKTCVDANGCALPKKTNSYTHSYYYNSSEFDDYPVIYINWDQAVAYCEWRDARLPTEAEWEKAARGIDGRPYPWGVVIDCGKANYSGCKGDAISVGNYESGKSPYGIYDLAGNVWEWTSDWYSSTYYQNSSFKNPLGPNSGQYHVLRGGSWSDDDSQIHSAGRFVTSPIFVDHGVVGFRCALSLP
jgi:formylglycine-generating enzyme required for sulfatase activity